MASGHDVISFYTANPFPRLLSTCLGGVVVFLDLCYESGSNPCSGATSPGGNVAGMYLFTWAITTNKIIAGIVVLAVIAVGAAIYFRRRGQNPVL